MKIFLSICVGLIIGFLIGYTTCALLCINDVSSKEKELSVKGDIDE